MTRGQRPLVMALDQGSHASRACLFDAGGKLLASHALEVATARPQPGWIEQDPLELLGTLRECIAAVLAQERGQVLAAGLATQRSTLVCCRRATLQPLSPALSWQDRRNDQWLRQLAPHATAVRERTGLPLSPHYGASKMRWCLDNLPGVRAAANAHELLLLPLASYLVAGLTGTEPLVDPANASRTLLWDHARFDWNAEQLALFGIAAETLPRCAPTCGNFGSVGTPDRPVPLGACTGDQSAVPFAAGAPDAGAIYINLGTGAFVQQPMREPPRAAAPLLASALADVAGELWHSLEGTVNGAGSALAWYSERRGCREAELWPALERLAPNYAPPPFVNGVGGLGSPWWQPSVEARFVDGEPAEDLAGFAAVLESIVFMLARNLELMRSRAGPAARVLVGGGISRSNWLCQRLADCLGVAVQRLPDEATARGVARLAAPHFTAGWPSTDGGTFAPRPVPGLQERRRRHDALTDEAATTAGSASR